MKTILITGATSGFGKACAEIFSKNGWKLIIAARRHDRLEKMQHNLGGEALVHTIPLDVRDRKKIEKNFGNLPDNFKNIDVLVNNAGLALGLSPSYETNLDEWENMVETNIKGLMYCTRIILPEMVKKNSGHIVNIGSIAGSTPYPGANVYGATKAFVEQFSRNLRSDLHGKNIRVTNIAPGLAETEFSIVRFNGDKEKASNIYEGTDPLTPGDIAEIIYWVVSLPKHVNINHLEVMPTCQAWDHLAVSRHKG